MNALFEKCIRDRRAEEARQAGLYPYFHCLESRQDIEVVMEGQRRIMLALIDEAATVLQSGLSATSSPACR